MNAFSPTMLSLAVYNFRPLTHAIVRKQRQSRVGSAVNGRFWPTQDGLYCYNGTSNPALGEMLTRLIKNLLTTTLGSLVAVVQCVLRKVNQLKNSNKGKQNVLIRQFRRAKVLLGWCVFHYQSLRTITSGWEEIVHVHCAGPRRNSITSDRYPLWEKRWVFSNNYFCKCWLV